MRNDSFRLAKRILSFSRFLARAQASLQIKTSPDERASGVFPELGRKFWNFIWDLSPKAREVDPELLTL
jgi:hypothetical protein